MTVTPEELAEAADLLRQLVNLADAGELEAKSPAARDILRRIEGAAIAAEAASRRPPTDQ